MNRNGIIRLLAWFIVLTCLLLPVHAANEKKCLAPTLSLLLNGNGKRTYSNEYLTINTKTLAEGNTKVTAVTNGSGQSILTSTVSITGLTIKFPDYDETVKLEFSTPLPSIPSDSAASYLAAFISFQISDEMSPLQNRDSPGCDGVPSLMESSCILTCCSLHDKCYKDYGCTAKSWKKDKESTECKSCNAQVSACILLSSILVNCDVCRCYDNKCDQFYDCGGSNCDCESPCTGGYGGGCGGGGGGGGSYGAYVGSKSNEGLRCVTVSTTTGSTEEICF